MNHPTQLTPRASAVPVIDVQEKLMAMIPAAETLTRTIAFLLDAAKLLDVDIAATEQYPQRLGQTVRLLAQPLPARPDKLPFRSCRVPNLPAGSPRAGPAKIVLAGPES